MRLYPAIGLTLVLGVLIPVDADAVTAGQIDTFEDGTTAGWTINLLGMGSPPAAALPTTVSTGGPAGPGDAYLQLGAVGGSGAGSRLSAINAAQWAGDYLASGVTTITLDVSNLGTTDLALRLLFENPVLGVTPVGPTDVAFSTDPITVPASSGWISVAFPITVADLTAEIGDVATALSTSTVFRIFHNPDPAFPGPGIGLPAIVATLGVDNICAVAPGVSCIADIEPVPEPGTVWLVGGSLMGLAALQRLRRRRAAL
jgi:hypothetical protein